MKNSNRERVSERAIDIHLQLSQRDLWGLQLAVNIFQHSAGDNPGNRATAERLRKLLKDAELVAIQDRAYRWLTNGVS